MVANPIKMDLVVARERCMYDTREVSSLAELYYNLSESAITNNHTQREIKDKVFRLLSECSNKSTAKKYHMHCLGLLSTLEKNDSPLFEEAFNHFLYFVYPYCEMSTMENINSKNVLSESYTKLLQEEAIKYKICDRIIDNHNKISKRFTTDTPTTLISVDEMCRNVCEMVDTYGMKPHIKMELAFEEISYLANKKSIEFNQQDMVESVCDYFLSIPDAPIDTYKKAILESPILCQNADEKIKYLTNSGESILEQNILLTPFDEAMAQIMKESNEDNKIKELINSYKMETEKSDSKFKQILNKIFTQSPNAIIDDTPDILHWVRNFAVLGIAAQSPITALFTLIINQYLHFDMKKKETERVINYFKNERSTIEDRIYSTSNKEKLSRLQEYEKSLSSAIDKLEAYNKTLYTDNEFLNKMDSEFGFNESYTFREAKETVIFDNLIEDSKNADKLIEKIAKDSLVKLGAKKTDVKDTIDESSITRYIDPESRISMILCSYDTRNCKNISDINESADAIVRGVNNALRNTKSKIYYTVLEGCVDFIFRSKFKVITSFLEETSSANSLTDVDMIRTRIIVEAAENMERLSELSPNTLVTKAIKKIGLISNEQAEIFIEAWGMGVPIDKEEIVKFVNEYFSYQNECHEYVDAVNFNKLYESIIYDENADLSTIVEATQIMNDILNEAVDLNNIKLAWMAAKKKMKGLSAREAEASRDLDAAFNNFLRGVKSFYQTTDNRERIIKGQICPSLSKMIKIGIGLAAIGFVSGGVVFPAVTAVVGIALSKNASDKERKMILDEIDIELQVIDREIKKVEDNGKGSKKYRTLLTYQKNLQREKQRIVYNLSRKGIPIPIKSTAGIGGKE